MPVVLEWIRDSWLGVLMREVPWLFPTFEALHFVGMALLFGVIAIIDLRILGFARALPVGPLHRLLPLAFLGFAINVITGVAFFASDPPSYFIVPAFRLKMLLIMLAGLNAIWFWLAVLRDVDDWDSGVSASPLAKIISLASLFFWITVITAGRFIAFAGTGTL